jgi:hypothetical protein
MEPKLRYLSVVNSFWLHGGCFGGFKDVFVLLENHQPDDCSQEKLAICLPSTSGGNI